MVIKKSHSEKSKNTKNIKKGSKKHSIRKVNSNSTQLIKKNITKDTPTIIKSESKDNFKKGLLGIDKQEEKFDKLFEQKLANQYKEFRNIKEHHHQTKKFLRIFVMLLTIVLLALFILTFS
jgi:hypothetical protein